MLLENVWGRVLSHKACHWPQSDLLQDVSLISYFLTICHGGKNNFYFSKPDFIFENSSNNK